MTTQRIALLALIAAVAPLASVASAQYRVDNSSARDASNRLGSGGYNDTNYQARLGGLAGNYIITGNVAGGRSFRGSLGYTDATAFRGSLGSANFDPFIRDSTSITSLRGNYQHNVATIEPFFGSQTAAPPAGFVRDPNFAGTFTQAPRQGVMTNDARIDFGGATRAQLARSYLSDQRAVLNSQAPGVAAPQTLQLSEFTALARRQEDALWKQAPDAAIGNVPALNRPDGVRTTDQINTQEPADLRLPVTPAGSTNTEDTSEARTPGSTGQSLAVRSSRIEDNNAQYAELRNRLAQRNGQAKAPQTVQPVQRTDNPNATQNDASQNKRLNPETGAPAGQTPGTPDTTQQPGIQRGVSPEAQATVPTDTLQLPRPTGDAPVTPTAPADIAPMTITSLATGVKDTDLNRTLLQAEELMKAGKFGSAIEAYDRAEEIANNDPLVFMGKGIAELGGSYYRKSEVHIRQAFAGDESLLLAKFDLRTLLTDERLNFLINDLGEVAKTNLNDPGPLLLLAFIYYNGGMEERAARALEIAQERAKGNDAIVKLLQDNWKLTPSK